VKADAYVQEHRLENKTLICLRETEFLQETWFFQVIVVAAKVFVHKNYFRDWYFI
jgi:hypothetical protein